MNAKISIEKGVVDGYPVMVRVEATDHLDFEYRFLVGLSEVDATRMLTDLATLVGCERLYVDCVSMDDHGTTGMSLYRDGGAEEGDRPVLVTLLPWDATS